MAADRTLMAWIRTSLSMFSFGYTIYKILNEVREIGKVDLHSAAPRNVGVLLTFAGTAALVMGIIEYLGNLHVLRRSYRFSFARPSLIMSAVMATAGLCLTAGILYRLL
jgi:putative membrane protein